jgi:hypothetical protein
MAGWKNSSPATDLCPWRRLRQKVEECLTHQQAQTLIRKVEKAQRKINDAEAS